MNIKVELLIRLLIQDLWADRICELMIILIP